MDELYCEVCSLRSSSKVMHEQHLSGQKHRKNLHRVQLLQQVLLVGGGEVKRAEGESPEREETHAHESIGTMIASASELPKSAEIVETKLIENAKSAFRCDLCQLDLTSKIMYDQHINGQKHKKKLNSMPKSGEVNNEETMCVVPAELAQFRCEDCELNLPSKDQLDMHLIGKKHKTQLAKKQIDKAYSGDDFSSFQTPAHLRVGDYEKYAFYCSTCSKYMIEKMQLVMHLQSKKHLAKLNCNVNHNNIGSRMGTITKKDKKGIARKLRANLSLTRDKDFYRRNFKQFVRGEVMDTGRAMHAPVNPVSNASVNQISASSDFSLQNYGYGYGYSNFLTNSGSNNVPVQENAWYAQNDFSNSAVSTANMNVSNEERNLWLGQNNNNSYCNNFNGYKFEDSFSNSGYGVMPSGNNNNGDYSNWAKTDANAYQSGMQKIQQQHSKFTEMNRSDNFMS